jgi:hypothetical protein
LIVSLAHLFFRVRERFDIHHFKNDVIWRLVIHSKSCVLLRLCMSPGCSPVPDNSQKHSEQIIVLIKH